MKVTTLLLLAVLCPLTALSSPATSQKDTLIAPASQDSASDSARLIVRFERKEIIGRQIYDTVAISLQAIDYPIAGFDLCFGTNSPYLDIISVLPGELIDSCGWEYFAAKQVSTAGKLGLPSALWKAIGLSEMLPDSVRPRCYGSNREITLAKVVVSNLHVIQMPETTASLFFFWQDCTDNTISSESGSKLLLSHSVLDYIEPDSPDTSQDFPTRRGAPRNCINPSRPNKPQRLIQFHNGGIDYRFGMKTNREESPIIPVTQDSAKIPPPSSTSPR